MTLEQLTAMGLSEEQAKKAMEGLDGSFVTKARFNEVNAELKQARETLRERDTQLETLKRSTGDVEALNREISGLQAENKAKDEQHQAEIRQMRLDASLNAALAAAKARNPETVKPLLKAFLDKAGLDGDGIKGLDAEIRKLAEAEDTRFLFAEARPDGKPGFRGVRPGEGAGRDRPGTQPATLADAVKAAMEQTRP
jgi:TolA-binding protein